ncbi:MAG TPA: MFS transporter [Candidatus Limnocylindrales bacterium]
MSSRLSAWLDHWSPVLPLLVAEGVIALGFGAILPILSVYYTHHGVDLPTLGFVVAAWPAARLLGEPFFGRLADRASRKRMMIAALLVSSVAVTLPVVVSGAIPFIILRAIGGLGAAAYDPAARGYLVDANPPERQGETFGLYSSAQMGGFMVGPAVGGLAAAITGEPSVVFWVFGLAYAVSALVVALRVADRPHVVMPTAAAAATAEAKADMTGDRAVGARIAATEPDADPDADDAPKPTRLLNRLLIVALVLNVGAYLAGGTYEVIWSLYMTSLGASFELIGVSFFTFSLPVLLLSPFTGRFVDRQGGFLALAMGMLGVAVCGLAYPAIPSVWWMIGLGLVEGTAAALSSPALYTLVARAAPPGRSSTAQGLFGAAGTSGTIVASIATGAMAAIDLRLPFIAMGVTTLVLLGLGLALGGRVLWSALQPHHLSAAVPASEVAG